MIRHLGEITPRQRIALRRFLYEGRKNEEFRASFAINKQGRPYVRRTTPTGNIPRLPEVHYEPIGRDDEARIAAAKAKRERKAARPW